MHENTVKKFIVSNNVVFFLGGTVGSYSSELVEGLSLHYGYDSFDLLSKKNGFDLMDKALWKSEISYLKSFFPEEVDFGKLTNVKFFFDADLEQRVKNLYFLNNKGDLKGRVFEEDIKSYLTYVMDDEIRRLNMAKAKVGEDIFVLDTTGKKDSDLVSLIDDIVYWHKIQGNDRKVIVEKLINFKEKHCGVGLRYKF